ncbi:MAG: menaquinone biosynthesis decarboxylase, partial [Flavisolibacter sp.]
NLNPASDIYFSQGPMDVLDHSCSKMGFGGKMCVDGTQKFEEETDENFLKNVPSNFNLDLKSSFPEIGDVNHSLLKKNIPALLVSIKKDRRRHVHELHQKICSLKEIESVKMILYVEHTVNPQDLPTALWRFCNNLDPKRDHSIIQRPSLLQPTKNFACMGLDGTIKTKEHDGFERDWPNIIVSDMNTIRSVDEKWERLGLGPFISSPSLKFQDQLYGAEAVVQV